MIVTNFEKEYDEVFGNYADSKLPRDALYFSIKEQIEKDEAQKKQKKIK